MMRGSGSHLFNVRKAVVHELADELVDDTVVGLSSLFARRNKPHATKKSELVAHDRHREAERLGEVTDAQFIVRQRVHDPHPNRVCQRLEDVDGLHDDFTGRNTLPSSHYLGGVHDLGHGRAGNFHSCAN